MRSKIKFLSKGILVLLLCGCMGCSKDPSELLPEELKVSNATAINPKDMVGDWNLTEMIADAAVDLNNDNLSSKNLLDETQCFNTMNISFFGDGTFITNNATMSFEAGEGGNDFSCISSRKDAGNWEVRNDSLMLHMNIDGYDYTHAKSINMEGNNFGFDVTKIESNQYVNDPGNTRASEIRILELTYSRAE